MRFAFEKKRLQRLYEEGRGANRYPLKVIEAFFEVMVVIASADSEQDLRALRWLHYHKLRGKRSGQHAIDLDRQWRLVVEHKEDKDGSFLSIIEIVDYH